MVPLGAFFFTDTDDAGASYFHLASILELDANTQGRSQDFPIRGAIQTDNNNT